MALKAKTLKVISQLSRRFVNYMKYTTVGPHILSKADLKDLVRAGYITSTKPPGTAIAQAYLKTHQQFAPEGAPKSTREGSIDFLERMFNRYMDKAGAQLETDISGQLEAAIRPFIDNASRNLPDDEAKHVYGLLRDKDIHKKYLGNILKDKVENWQHRWKMIVNTELSRASNYGAVDAILHNNRAKPPEEIRVYKVGPHDGDTCEYCYKFWFMPDRVTPRVYLLSELIANGTNHGRKQKDWMPTIDITHPHERHILVQLGLGSGFDKSGNVKFISKDHDEHKNQQGSSR